MPPAPVEAAAIWTIIGGFLVYKTFKGKGKKAHSHLAENVAGSMIGITLAGAVLQFAQIRGELQAESKSGAFRASREAEADEAERRLSTQTTIGGAVAGLAAEV